MGSRILALAIGAHPGLFPVFHFVDALPGIIRHAGQGVSEIWQRAPGAGMRKNAFLYCMTMVL
jgi:hypothetical protein